MKAICIQSKMSYTIILILFLGGFSFLGWKNVVAQESLLILSDDLLTALEPGGPTLFDRILVEQNVAWADFRQEDHSEMRSAGVIFHETAAGPEWGTGINPAVILVTYGVERNWELPANGDLVSEVENIRAALFQYTSEWVHGQVDQNQYPVANGATYVLYHYFNGDLSKLQDWQSNFTAIFGVSPTQTTDKVSTFTATSSNVVAPFLQRPFDQLAYPFRHITSFFDHHYPIYTFESDRTDMFRFDGYSFTGIPSPDNCGYGGDTGSGNYCYSGHPAYDYAISDISVKAAAAGYIVECFSDYGALWIEHENGLITSYLHMDPLYIPNGILCSDVSAERPYVEQGQIIGNASNKSPNPIGDHLHFGVGYEANIGERQNIDPFGWWGDVPDPWESYDGTLFDGLKSYWLWLGDEAGDGYLTVDNMETQAQLFNPPSSGSDWNHLNAGYQNDSWWSYLTHYATLPPDPSSKTSSIYWGVWGVNIEQPGIYEVQAYWPADPNPAADPVPTKKATYSLYYHDTQGNIQSVTLYADQSRDAGQFTTLCAVPYENDPNGCPQYPEIQFGSGTSVLILRDSTTDTIQSGKYMVFFDAVRWQDVTPSMPTPTLPATNTPLPTSTPNPIYQGAIPSQNNGGPAIVTISNLIPGMQYRIVVSGVVNYSSSILGDAQWNNYQNPYGCFCRYGPAIRFNEVALAAQNGQTVYDPNHTYTFLWLADSTQLQMYVGDSYYADNSGSFSYQIFENAFLGTPTSIPTSSGPTLTFTPQPTPASSCPWEPWFYCSGSSGQSNSQQFKWMSLVSSNLVSSIEEITLDVQLFYRVRDELLSLTPQGNAYIDLYYEHGPEIGDLVLANPALYQEGLILLQDWEPKLRALLDGQGNTVFISQQEVDAVNSFLLNLESGASLELQTVIQHERLDLNMQTLVGLTMSHAWAEINAGGTPTPTTTFTPTPTFTPTATATKTATPASVFPSTGILDNFNRANGAIGSNWSGNTAGYNISSNKLLVKSRNANLDIYWNNAYFGPNQEVYFTFSSISATATDQDLILKSQSTSGWGYGFIEIWYDAVGNRVQVWTFDQAQSWVQHGADIPVTFVNGDQFGARARADGTVEVYRNGVLLGTRNVATWPHYASGGYLGIWFGNAKDVLIDNFGGGNVP